MKEKIELTAMELFLKKGHKNVSLIEIAKKLNITKGGIYHYYSSKEELLISVFDRILDNYLAVINDFESRNEQGQKFKNFTGYIVKTNLLAIKEEDTAVNHYEFLINCIRGFPELKDKIRDAYKDMQDYLIKLIEHDIQADLLGNDLRPEEIAFEFGALFEGMLTIREIYAPKEFNQMVQATFNRFYSSLE